MTSKLTEATIEAHPTLPIIPPRTPLRSVQGAPPPPPEISTRLSRR